jgi:hypothetical protein
MVAMACECILKSNRSSRTLNVSRNTGIEDALHIGWRLSALVKGYGGPLLIESYDTEQRRIMLGRVERCFQHFNVPGPFRDAFNEHGAEMGAKNAKGEAIRAGVKAHLDAIGSEVLDYGIELDSRYKSPIIFLSSADGDEPAWDKKHYTPSTYPGSRVPHIFLKDAKKSIVDTLGTQWTLVAFTNSGEEAQRTDEQVQEFVTTATEANMPIQSDVLVDEDHARRIWGYNFVLVRADGHVAWRGQKVPDTEEIKHILKVVTGWESCEGYSAKEIVGELDFLRTEFPEVGPNGVGEEDAEKKG